MTAPKVKVGLSIFMTESNEIGFQTTSENKVTLLGMLEFVKHSIMNDTLKKKEESVIQPISI